MWPVLAVALMLSCRTAAAEQAAAPRIIRVSGNAVVKAAPDRVRVAVSVTTRALTAREATEKNARTSKEVLDKLRAAVHAPGEVSTAGYDLGAEYDYSQQAGTPRGPRVTGYVATNRLSIVTPDLPGVGALLDAAVAAGANQIDSIGFFLDDEDAARQQALQQAGHKARAEAEAVAQSLGVKLGPVLEASTTSAVTPLPMVREKTMMAMDTASAPTEVVPGSLDIGAAITVTFGIE